MFIHNRNEPYLPLPSQPQLVLIYRPRRDGRLSRPWCEVAPAEIRTRNLPIANPALYHTATSTSEVTVTEGEDVSESQGNPVIFLTVARN